MSTSPKEQIYNPWSQSAVDVVQSLGSDATLGLTTDEASRRLKQYGRNEIPEPQSDPIWLRYWGQLTGDAVVRLLLIGGIASLLLGDYLEGASIILMLNIMAAFGLWQEGKANDAARSLRQADNPLKFVFRNGKRVELPIGEIVPGDIVYLPTGAVAPADGRVTASVNAEKDSAKLTGESMPVDLSLAPLAPTTIMNEQSNMVHRGDGITAGNATMVVTATGSQTEIGKIAARLAESESVPTPLDDQLDQLGAAMARIFIWIAVVVIGAGLVREFFALAGEEGALTAWTGLMAVKEAFINAVALIIAAIPEGLPAVLTITLAIATKVMAKRQALVRKPKAVEGGGSMTVLLTDKTGTLTANQMEVTKVYANGEMMDADKVDGKVTSDPVFERAVRVARLCNNNSSATEGAILRWVERAGFEAVGDIESRHNEHEFDQSLKRMTTVHKANGEDLHHILTKGAPEQVVLLCHQIHENGHDVPLDEARQKAVESAVYAMAEQGLRVIALADRIAPNGHELDRESAERELTLVSLLGIMDPPRTDVAPAVATLSGAGIRTVMVTGDNPITAYQIAKQVGIIQQDLPFDQAVITGDELAALANPTPRFLQRLHTVRVFARVTPQHKASIVHAMRDEGFIVGMTGDGVNDAIALQDSDVGFAMGNGTDVAREASDVILMDSRFGTIPNAVEEGRNVLHRIRLYLSYILSGNGCEVGAFVVAYLLGIPIPLTALVLLVINFATDSFPALAMAFEPGEKDVMLQKPRDRDAPFINRVMWIHIAVQTLAATVVIMLVYYYVYKNYFPSLIPADADLTAFARSAAFMTYIFQKLYRAFTARSLTKNVWEIGVFTNRWSIGAVALSLSIALFFVYMPVVNSAMGLAALPIQMILITMAAGLVPPVAEEITKLFLRSGQTRSGGDRRPAS